MSRDIQSININLLPVSLRLTDTKIGPFKGHFNIVGLKIRIIVNDCFYGVFVTNSQVIGFNRTSAVIIELNFRIIPGGIVSGV